MAEDKTKDRLSQLEDALFVLDGALFAQHDLIARLLAKIPERELRKTLQKAIDNAQKNSE